MPKDNSRTEVIKGVVYTTDKIAIAYEHKLIGSDRLIIVCPGFFNSMKNRWMRAIRDAVSCEYDTLIFDFRGHGKSKGKCCFTARERLDLEAILRLAEGQHYAAIGIIGFSLGAATAVNTVSHYASVKSMVLVSTPMNFFDINCHFWEPEMFSDLKDNFECNWEGKGVRWGNLFLRKPKPISEIKRLKDIPIMFVHGTNDWIIKDYHSRELYQAYPACEGVKKLVLIKGGLHAERLIQFHRDKMEDLILGWFRKTLGGKYEK